MRSPFLQFLVRLSVFTLFLGLIAVILYALLPAGYASVTVPFQFVLFYAVTLAVHYLLLKASEKSPGSFVTRFMLVSFLKLLFYIIVLIAYLFLNKSDVLRFTVSYLVLYVLYSAFEITSITRFSKKNTTNQQDSRS